MCVWMRVPLEARRGCQTLWGWHCRWLKITQGGCWGPDSDPLQEHHVLLTTRQSATSVEASKCTPRYSLQCLLCCDGSTVISLYCELKQLHFLLEFWGLHNSCRSYSRMPNWRRFCWGCRHTWIPPGEVTCLRMSSFIYSFTWQLFNSNRLINYQ